MPTRIHTDADLTSSNLPPVPAWGTLPLDIYLLEQWSTPHPDSPNETPSQRRRRLVRQFLNLGSEGRDVYYKRTPVGTPWYAKASRREQEQPEYTPAQPTEEEIETILRPLRPEHLRQFAAWTDQESEGVWIRTSYGGEEKSDEAHRALWEEYVEDAEAMGPDSLVIDDEGVFADMDVEQVLEVFPEWITNYGGGDNDWREQQLREMIEEEKEDEEEDIRNEGVEVVEARRRKREMNPARLCEKYWVYHVACVVAHAFVEDAEAQRTGEVLHVFLDDCGRVVRQERTDSNSVANYDGAWFERTWKEGFIYPGDLGAAYHFGGPRGPPYW